MCSNVCGSVKEWMFFAALPKADRLLAVIWWAVLLLRGILPALFAIAMGVLVAAVQTGDALAARSPSSASSSCCCRS